MLLRFILWLIIFYLLYHSIVKFIRYFKEAYEGKHPKVKTNGKDRMSHSKYEDVEEAKFWEIKNDTKKKSGKQ